MNLPLDSDDAVLALWWGLLALMVVIGTLTAFLRVPTLKGYLGEWLVRFTAWFMLEGRKYRQFHNVTLPTPDGTTQIDHVIISRYGIFVIETKNMKGWIFGRENDSQWTQKFRKSSFQFQNPMRQNFKHLKVLQEALQVPQDKIHSIVTFVGGCTFKTPMPASVTRRASFIKYVRSFRAAVFTDDEVGILVLKLNTNRLAPTIATWYHHLQNLKGQSRHTQMSTRSKDRKRPDATRFCYKCGGMMVIRSNNVGSRIPGLFWGCSNYPKCDVVYAISPPSDGGSRPRINSP